MNRKRMIRIILLAITISSLIVVFNGYMSQSLAETSADYRNEWHKSPTEREVVTTPREKTTVVTLQGAPSAPSKEGQIIAFDPNGTVEYYNESLDNYADVDPVPGTRATVMYVGATHMRHSCNPGLNIKTSCIRQIIETVNLSTGATNRLWARPTIGVQTWHDVDLIDQNQLLVGDIQNDRVFIINVSTNIIEFSWSARDAYQINEGGRYPEDFTHLNDVEDIEPGRLMVNLRNMNQIVFINTSDGLDHRWTLGKTGNESILNRHHNSDYIPRSQGGPAVLVADSDNNRLIEYQRQASKWEQTWVWSDSRLHWPRDVDRLPNGHTLAVDSNGDRVVEIDQDGSIVWSVPVHGPYDAERLGTGDESSGGESAARLGIRSYSRVGSDRGDNGFLQRRVLPKQVVNPLLFITPAWMHTGEILASFVFLLTVLVWLVVELRWSRVKVAIHL